MGNTHSSIGNKPLLGGAVGGLLLSSIGLVSWLFFNRLNRATRLDNLSSGELYSIEQWKQLHTTIDALRKDIEELKAIREINFQADCGKDDELVSRKSAKSVRFRRTHSVLSAGETEYQSAWSGNDELDEFFDLADVEETENLPSEHSRDQLTLEPFEIFDKVDSLLEGSTAEHELAFQMLKDHEAEYNHNVEFLWRLSKCLHKIATSSMDARKKEMSYKAVDYAARAIQADCSNAEANKWYAISIGSLGEYVGVSEKIRNGVLFKQHIDHAISANPSDPLLHHLLGRFNYEVSMLSWVERKVAATLFSSEMPSGSIEEGLVHFLESEELCTKPWKENRLFVARCFIQLGRYSEAIDWIERAISIHAVKPEDQTIQEELFALERKYKAYRRV